MVKYGLDVQRWTHVYVGLIPTSNAPNTYQALNRVCTPYNEATRAKLGPKPQPIVRIVIDEMSASVFCFAKIYKDSAYGLSGALSGKNYFGVKLAFTDPKTAHRLEEIAKHPKSYSAADVGVAKVLGKNKKRSAWKPTPSGVTEL
jgi:hypothetical protein